MPSTDERRLLKYVCSDCPEKNTECDKTEKIKQCAKEKLTLINEKYHKDLGFTSLKYKKDNTLI